MPETFPRRASLTAGAGEERDCLRPYRQPEREQSEYPPGLLSLYRISSRQRMPWRGRRRACSITGYATSALSEEVQCQQP